MSFGPPITPTVVKQLMIANAVVYVAQVMSEGWGLSISHVGAVVPALFWSGWLWQPFTYMFLHGGLAHIAMNTFALWMFGSPIALLWGPKRFLQFYLVCGVGAGLIIAALPALAALVGLRFPSLSMTVPTVGASGAIYGVIMAYSLTYPNRTIMLMFPPVAFRAIWLIPVLFLIEWTLGPGNVSHVGHLGGAAVAYWWLNRGVRGGGLPSAEQLRFRMRRWRMRRNLRALRNEDLAWRDRSRRDDQKLH
jgi:membrane associated rhomboid family serine protease